VGAGGVMGAGYEVAACLARLPSTARIVDASDLPATGHAWVVRERVLEDYSGPEQLDKSEVTIPAWSAETELENLLTAKGSGFGEIVNAVLAKLPPDPRGDRASATQVASAHFHTNQFS